MESNSTLKDNLIGFLICIVLTAIAWYIGVRLHIGFITGIPFIGYGVYGFFSKRLWDLGSQYTPARFVTQNVKYTVIGHIAFGIILSIICFNL
jgi:heme/copper-type cytochrome/quinol oxidase subunit 4